MAYPSQDLLVESSWLRDRLEDPRLVIIDCPWEAAAYGRAHIPGSLLRPGHPYVKVETDGEPGLHFPTASEFRNTVKSLGIQSDSTVVCYDDWGSLFGARLWWVLKLFGHADARILNGGWQAWIKEGHPISFERPKHQTSTPIDLTTPHGGRFVTVDEILETGVQIFSLIDARSDDEYQGKTASGNKRKGHVPGAIHLEWNRLLENSDNSEAVRKFRSAAEIQTLLDAAGITKDRAWTPYCQAGVRGAFMGFALELMGYTPARVYDGSMGEWANLEKTPLEV
jgi:thiosulfate/3-mercaptopyruvate sulfurtransferase